MADNIKKVGWLIKQGAVVKSWKKRWFSLHGKDIRYYEKKEDEGKKKPKGSIVLTKDTFTSIEDIKKFAFSLKTNDLNRTYYFVGSSNEDRAEWIETINKVIQSIPNTTSGTTTQEISEPTTQGEKTMWETHIQGLSGDLTTQMESLQNLFQMLEGTNPTSAINRKDFSQQGGIKALVTIMKDKSAESDVRAASAQVLGVVGQDDSVRDIILKEGGIEAAKILLDSTESKLQKYGCFVLVCVTQHSLDGEKGNSYECCLALEKTKVLISLADLIKNTSEEKTKSWSTSCLGNCAFIKELRSTLMDLVSFPVMVSLLKEEHWETQANAAHLISNISINPEFRSLISEQEEIIELLVSLLDSEKNILKRFVLRALSNLGLNEKAQKRFMEAKGVEKIKSILEKFEQSDAQVVASACMVVVNTSTHQEINQLFISSSLKNLLEILSSSNFALQLYSLRAIFNLDRFCESNRTKLNESGIQNILKSLISTSKNSDLLLVAEAFLHRIEKGIVSKKEFSVNEEPTTIEKHFVNK